jgi:hypothetical protein
MSSVLRSVSGIPTMTNTLQPKHMNITTACYDNSVANLLTPIPFVYNNGVLDIAGRDNVVADLIDGEGSDPYPIPVSFNLVRQYGGRGLVTSLGGTMLDWLEHLFSDEEGVMLSDISNIRVHTPSTVTKIQYNTNQGNNPYDGLLGQFSASGFHNVAPPSDDYIITGTDTTEYNTCYVFLTPLTIEYTVNGNKRYFTLNSTFTKNVFFFP